MLIALRPEFVAAHWDEISSYVGTSLPPVGLNEGMALSRVLERILTGNLTCWLVVSKDKVVEGVLLTCTSEDFTTGTKTLLLYALAGDISDESWEEGYVTLVKHARAHMCRLLGAYTENERVLEMSRKYNFNTNVRYIFLEV